MKEAVENTARMEKCPSFINCSAPKCPLDEFMADRVHLTGEPKCTANKRTRVKIGIDMANFGLFPNELTGYMLIYKDSKAVQERLKELFLCVKKKQNDKKVVG